MEPFERYSVHSKSRQPTPQTPQSQPAPKQQTNRQKQKKTQKSPQLPDDQTNLHQRHHQLQQQKQQEQLQQQLLQQLQQQQQQQQQQQSRHPSTQAFNIHIRSQPSPPTKPKPRHYDVIRNQSSPGKQEQKEEKLSESNKNPRDYPKPSKQSSNKTNLVLSNRNPSTEISAKDVMTSQPRTISRGKKQYSKNPVPINSKSAPSDDNKGGKPNKNKNKTKHKTKQNTTGPSSSSSGQQQASSNLIMKSSKNSVGALESGIPDRFCDSPDNKGGNALHPTTAVTTTTTTAASSATTTTVTTTPKKKSKKKFKHHDLTDIPQTNLSVGLIVFCCFNPVFGALAIYMSLAAAKAYRDGNASKGNSRSHWSILISLFGITVTMVIVSTMVVIFSISRHSNSHFRQATSKALGF